MKVGCVGKEFRWESSDLWRSEGEYFQTDGDDDVVRGDFVPVIDTNRKLSVFMFDTQHRTLIQVGTGKVLKPETVSDKFAGREWPADWRAARPFVGARIEPVEGQRTAEWVREQACPVRHVLPPEGHQSTEQNVIGVRTLQSRRKRQSEWACSDYCNTPMDSGPAGYHKKINSSVSCLAQSTQTKHFFTLAVAQ